MRKSIFVFIVFMSYPALAQIRSGTIIVFNLTKDKIIVAADSRLVNHNGTPPSNTCCKVSAFRHQFVFATAGDVFYARAAIDLIDSWNNAELARNAIRNVSRKEDTQEYLNDVATYWARSVGQRWDPFCKRDRAACEKLVENSKGMLTSGIFIGPRNLLSGAVITFNSTDIFNPIQYGTGTKMSQCWPCGQETGKQICVVGSYYDIAASICAKRPKNAKVRTQTHLPGYDGDVRLPVQIVELTIEAYDKSAGDVGGPIDILSITKGGSMHWIKRKDNCPENQD